jgi:glutathione peroxidase
MKTLSILLLGLALTVSATAGDSIHGISMKTLQGKPLKLAGFKGQAVLVVNVASHCGYTGQYSGLQSLYRQNKAKGLVVLGVPCNDFGKQEPGKPAEIAAFCKKNYGVSFPLTEKVGIRPGAGQHPLYKTLTTGGRAVGWNFEKILVGKDGKVIKRFGSGTEPNDPALAKAIAQAVK